MTSSLALSATTWAGLIVVYGLLVAIGGVIGYVKAGSKVSLISGLGSGVALAIAAYTTTQNPSTGLSLAVFIAAFLLIVFAIRWIKTKKMMPAGMMAILSLVAVILFGAALSV
ncbi:MAG: TMEM14 family protein [Myxacorys chilensis ATA2-1-KO14]|jgi:uncharacterized membrane protein (UPF0136 family)|nr:TMEM14 family protein [Myxacorys chilensis ATA2-1-KO14]